MLTGQHIDCEHDQEDRRDFSLPEARVSNDSHWHGFTALKLCFSANHDTH